MFSTVGNMTKVCIGDLNSLSFPGQVYVEIIDMVVGIITLLAGTICIAQGNYAWGTPLIALSIFQSHIMLANFMACVKMVRARALNNQ